MTSCAQSCLNTGWQTQAPDAVPPSCPCVLPLELILTLGNGTVFERNVTVFLHKLASQLGLLQNGTLMQLRIRSIQYSAKQVQITLWILPLNTSQFSSANKARISSELSSHAVILDPNYGNYSFISLNQLLPPSPPPPSMQPPLLPLSHPLPSQ